MQKVKHLSKLRKLYISPSTSVKIAEKVNANSAGKLESNCAKVCFQKQIEAQYLAISAKHLSTHHALSLNC